MPGWVRGAATVLILGPYAISACAERLPIRTYTSVDGLPQDNIQRIFQDARGNLWFATTGGISRFDGERFVNYGIEQGLPGEDVTDVVEANPGEYWVATTTGACLLHPGKGAAVLRFLSDGGAQPSAHVNRLLRDRSGRLWAGTDEGLFVLDRHDLPRTGRDDKAAFHVVGGFTAGHNPQILSLLEDRLQTLWIGTNSDGLYRRWLDGHMDHYSSGKGLSGVPVQTIADDRRGRVWAGTGVGLILLSEKPRPGGSIAERFYATPAPTDTHIWDLLSGSNGHLWLGTSDGLYEFDGGRWKLFSKANGLTQSAIRTLFEDRDANLWIGSASAGVMKIAHSGFTSFDERDGLAMDCIYSIFQTRTGQLCATTGPLKDLLVNCFNGTTFNSVRPHFPAGISYFGWGRQQTALQDRFGEWWVATGQGLVRFGKTTRVAQLASMSPAAVYTKSSGLAGNDVFRLFEDSRGDIWISTIDEGGGLVRWHRSQRKFQAYGREQGIRHAVSAFREDALGNLWMGFYNGGIVRYRDGQFTSFGGAEGLPAGLVFDLLFDRRGRLWVATRRGGLGRADHPAGSRVHFRTYTTADGLSGVDLSALLEDKLGRIYVTTPRGLDRIDPETDKIGHYTTTDGLATNHPEVAFRDQEGNLWFGSSQGGLSRLTPEPDRPKPRPSIWIDSIQVGGRPHPLTLSPDGAFAPVTIPHNQKSVQIDFAAVTFAAGDVLKYQYRLEGADAGWSTPGGQHRVNYANLAAGHYRFIVRAINADGDASPSPAVIPIAVLEPFWRRWWFVSLCVMGIVLQMLLVHRWLIARAVAFERIRGRIATDLHDDIGSSLSQVALLAEVVQRRIAHGERDVGEQLSKIGIISADLIDSMTDIVWAINPRHDRMHDLLHRMKRFANDLCVARNLDLDFHGRNLDSEIRLGPEVRRQVYLIFKESVSNVARHSHATKVAIDVGIQGKRLVLCVTDNGIGFTSDNTGEGNGLRTMRERAASAGGVLLIESRTGEGTSVRLQLPLNEHWKGVAT